MKKITLHILFVVLFSCAVSARAERPSYPRPSGWIGDFAGVISPEYKQKITDAVTELEQKTSAEVAVVTVPRLENETIEDFSVRLFKEWGIGKKGKDNGVLLAASIEDRKVRIEVGYGLEGLIPDGKSGAVLDSYVLPAFRKGEYGEGLYQGALAVSSVIAKDAGVQLNGERFLARRKSDDAGTTALFNLLFIFLFFGFVPFVSFLMRRKKGKRFYGGGYWGGFGGGGFGGGGGGFGGFGGGMSGGGGASRGW